MKSQLLGAIFLIAGTCVGGGMLALPVDTGHAGFLPSAVMMLATWTFMTMTALLLVEANLWMEEGAHIMTMATRLLGSWGKAISLILFLFIAYASLVAYTTGGGKILEFFSLTVFDHTLLHWESCLLFTVLFGSLIYFGTKILGRVNVILVAGMILAYLGLIVSGVTKVSIPLLLRQNWSVIASSAPLLLTIFSFQMIIPSLTPYLNRDPKLCRKAVILGMLIPLIAYLLWQWIVFGNVPLEGETGLALARQKGLAATESFRLAVQNPWLTALADFFGFFALATSYLGIALGLFDFLADSMKMVKKGFRKLFLLLCVLIPSLVFGVIYPRAFLLALEITGGFGDAILNGALPVLMVWSGRYYKKYTGPYQFFGGKKILGLLFAFASFVVMIQIKNIFHW